MSSARMMKEAEIIKTYLNDWRRAMAECGIDADAADRALALADLNGLFDEVKALAAAAPDAGLVEREWREAGSDVQALGILAAPAPSGRDPAILERALESIADNDWKWVGNNSEDNRKLSGDYGRRAEAALHAYRTAHLTEERST